MKRLILALALCTGFVTLANAQAVNWKEMHDFHAVMSVTFHPAEENDLQPVKNNAAELVKQAKRWQASAIPEGIDKKAAGKTLKKLVKQCKDIQAAVKDNKSDATLKEMITEAHEIFHELMEKCRKGDDHKN